MKEKYYQEKIKSLELENEKLRKGTSSDIILAELETIKSRLRTGERFNDQVRSKLKI